MKRISLSQGKYAIVDDGDYEWLSQWKWSCYRAPRTCYAYRTDYSGGRGKYKTVHMHRKILDAKSDQIVDHINHNGLDNRRENIRIVNFLYNKSNSRKIFPDSKRKLTSKYKGVSKSGNRWNVRIWDRNLGKQVTVCGFKSQSQAAEKYNELAREIYGEYAFQNVIRGKVK